MNLVNNAFSYSVGNFIVFTSGYANSSDRLEACNLFKWSIFLSEEKGPFTPTRDVEILFYRKKEILGRYQNWKKTAYEIIQYASECKIFFETNVNSEREGKAIIACLQDVITLFTELMDCDNNLEEQGYHALGCMYAQRKIDW